MTAMNRPSSTFQLCSSLCALVLTFKITTHCCWTNFLYREKINFVYRHVSVLEEEEKMFYIFLLNGKTKMYVERQTAYYYCILCCVCSECMTGVDNFEIYDYFWKQLSNFPVKNLNFLFSWFFSLGFGKSFIYWVII